MCSVMISIIVHRKAYRRLFFFTIYLAANIIWGVLWRYVSRTPAFYLLTWLYIYWSVELLLSILRLLTIAEIARRFLRGYPAIRAFASRLLTGVAAALLLWTTYSAIHNLHHIRRFILLGDQRFECMQVVLLLTLLIIGAYYRIQIPPLYRLILIGIGVYSSIQVANNGLGMLLTILPNSIFDYLRRGASMVSLVIWTYAVWRWSAIPDPQPRLIPQSTYDRLSPELHDRLQDLNDRLAGLVGQRSR